MGIPILEGYGLTETSPVVVSERYGPTELTQGGLRPVPGVNVFVCQVSGEDEEGDAVSLRAVPVTEAGDEGEICVVGPNVMQGYWGREDATAEVLVPLDLPDGQVATAFQPLRDHAKAGLPFFLKWHAARPAAFCWVEAKPQPVAFADPKFLGGSLDVAAIVEGVTP